MPTQSWPASIRSFFIAWVILVPARLMIIGFYAGITTSSRVQSPRICIWLDVGSLGPQLSLHLILDL